MDRNEERYTEEEEKENDVHRKAAGVIYSVEDTPPWYLCVFLGFQVRYLTFIRVH